MEDTAADWGKIKVAAMKELAARLAGRPEKETIRGFEGKGEKTYTRMSIKDLQDLIATADEQLEQEAVLVRTVADTC